MKFEKKAYTVGKSYHKPGECSRWNNALGELKRRSELFEDDVYACLEPEACVKARSLPGGPAPQEVLRQIGELRKTLD
jgi:argininosuccinate lyase